jgi:ribosome maturation factor RimP
MMLFVPLGEPQGNHSSRVGFGPPFFLLATRMTNLEPNNALQQKLWSIIEPLVVDEALELWDLRFTGKPGKSGTLAIFVDREGGGIQLEECSALSRKIGVILDVEDPFSGAFHLEVSSPGIDRVLRQQKHFNLFVGERVRLKLFQSVEGRRKFSGKLKEVNDSAIRLEVDGLGETDFPMEDIQRANLIVDKSNLGRR